MFAARRAAGVPVSGEELRILRNAALTIAVAAVVCVLISRESLELVREAIGSFGRGLIAILSYSFVLVSALAVVALAWIMTGFTHALRTTSVRVLILSVFAVIVVLPTALVVLLNEHRSPYWYLVFLLFLPLALLTGAQLALAAASLGRRRSDAIISSFAILAVPCAGATSLIFLAFFYFRFQALGLVGVAFAFLAVVCNLIVAGRSTILIGRNPSISFVL